ncbi:alpha/beta fold hydrolase [Actinoalloteichus caeruleus]|uniref:Pimeloyl-ACP methyl ester carboxylesterase n=1 Tax=Actinoalloteichus caeruleus DSM 43889 TaxID=1120930 RepID=A0ABT1JPZ1_ACTCY|nr:alpha/beta hydrolase [Actinoalloteichus caeruleus]MCP2334590.1 Pimeloyl-ACP methyl ester carboxylesterase [Actinoalloteichus caeruleus DSM 43889]
MPEHSQAFDFRGFTCEIRIVDAEDPALAPLVLLGGAFQDKHSWARHEREFLRRTSVVTVDLPGWGSADPLPRQYGVDFLCEALHHLLVSSGLSRVNVGAGSYGSGIAYRLAQRFPGLVDRLVLVGTMTELPERARADVENTVRLLRSGDRDTFAERVIELLLCQDPGVVVRKRDVLRRLLGRQLRQLGEDAAEKYVHNTERLLAYRWDRSTSPPTLPILVMTGEHDPFTTPELCREVAKDCPDARFTTVRDSDHLVYLERPVEFVEVVLTFLSGEPVDVLPCCTPVEYFGAARP